MEMMWEIEDKNAKGVGRWDGQEDIAGLEDIQPEM